MDWLEDAVALSGLGPTPLTVFPRNMEEAVVFHLPRVSLVPVAGLTTHWIRDWFSRRHIAIETPAEDRAPHGCTAAIAEHGYIFWDTQDPEDVQRFTLAHEVAHFVVDHLQPRQEARRALGKRILEVFDGKREPNIEEGLSAMFKRIPLAQLNLMHRGVSGDIRQGEISFVEHRADRLAFELLAPASHALPLLQDLPRKQCVDALVSRFGLPRKKARTYVRLLLGPERPRFSIQKYFDDEEEG
ncbi:ImmA/IrrE family metallo-endopeptidase [Melittangium boletus]|uniref:ImmA/IrrE family metallo-endopeptidase n=1 Tax=Melittangium boletus TaxID=83453 RepID=UPI003DA598EB